MAWTTLCTFEDLSDALGREINIEGHQLAVFKLGEVVHVIDNLCPHAGGSMSAGWVEDGCAVCPLHGWAFDLVSGSLRGGAYEHEMIRVYPSRILNEPDGRRFVQADLPMP